LFGQIFYFGLMRKYVVLVGVLLSDLRIMRTIAGANTELLTIPLQYGPKDKMIARIEEDAAIDRPAADILPMISYEMTDFTYDKGRKLNTINKNIASSSNGSFFNYQYTPVPYDIDFKVYVYVKNTEDGTKIMEQILPYFTPDWTLAVNLIPQLNTVMNIPVVIKNISCTDTYSGDFKKRRAIIWSIDLTVKGYFYGPIKQAYTIQFVDMPIIIGDPTSNNIPSSVVNIIPGLTSNGQPTDNSSMAIPYQQVSVTNDFGYVTNIINIDTGDSSYNE
jgi:hypothetical protein